MGLGHIIIQEELDEREYDYLRHVLDHHGRRAFDIQAPSYLHGKDTLYAQNHPSHLGPQYDLKALPQGYQVNKYLILAVFIPEEPPLK